MSERRRGRGHPTAGRGGPAARPGMAQLPAGELRRKVTPQPTQIQGWEILALFLGASCSSDPEYGPKLVLDHMTDTAGWWDDVNHVMGFCKMTAGMWGLVVQAQGRHAMPLHRVECSDPPTVEELRQIAWTRERENQRFQEGWGLSAKPEDKADQAALAAMGDFAKAHLALKAIDRELRRNPPASPEAARFAQAALEQVTLDFEDFHFRMGCLALRLRDERERREPPVEPERLPCHCGSGRLGGACHLRAASGA
ncbi:MAG: hypothetical protein ACYCWW_18730 [Deltaproteobacteria bacterium]